MESSVVLLNSNHLHCVSEAGRANIVRTCPAVLAPGGAEKWLRLERYGCTSGANGSCGVNTTIHCVVQWQQ
eukprot:6005645-Amphidinium_carterae.1